MNDKRCSVCSGREAKKAGASLYAEIEPSTGELEMWKGYYRVGCVPIKFCPFCGSEITKENTDE